MSDVVHNHQVERGGAPDGSPRDTLRDRFLDWRVRIIQKPSFIRWATRFPLTRPLSRQKTSQLFDLVAGFVYTQIVTTCVRVKLLECLAERSLTASQISTHIGLNEDATLRLVRGAQALELVSARSVERFGLGELGAALLANPGVIAMIEHHQILYEDLRDPLALLKDQESPTNLSRYWAYAQAGAPDALAADSISEYSALMAASQGFISDEVLGAYPLQRHQRLMDVGGGEGRFAHAALSATPNLHATVFDLPAVAQRARRRLGDAGLSSRFDAQGGDFFTDSLPKGADIISLVRILHDHDDDKALLLLRQVRAALEPGQAVLVAEPMAGTSGAQKAGDAYFGFYLLAMRSGRPRTEEELRSFLTATGFGFISSPKTANPLLTRVLIARAV
ncbi:MAG: methyltransferase [Devosiaceae bacterium]